jgi:hypothetical protein
VRQPEGGIPGPPPAPLLLLPELELAPLELPEPLVVVPEVLPPRFMHEPCAHAKPWLQSLLVVHCAVLELPQAATRAESAAKRAEAMPSFCMP